MILWVDDNDELRRAVAEHLAAARHRVVEAGSAEAALVLLDAESEPELLITDLRLSGQSGLQLAETLRSRAPGLPVVLVTSHATPDELAAWTDDPAFAVLQKPFEMDELEAAVSALLAGETPAQAPQPQTSSAQPLPPSAQAASPEPLPFPETDSSSPTQNPPWLRFALAAVVALAIVGGTWPWIAPGSAPPELPDAPSTDDVRRGGTIQTLDPFGPLATAPRAFRWQPATDAAHYRVHVEDVAGSSLWQGETNAVELTLPSELANRLLPLAAYYWRVEAFDGAGQTIAASEPVRFRIVTPDVELDVEPDLSQPDPERSSP